MHPIYTASPPIFHRKFKGAHYQIFCFTANERPDFVALYFLRFEADDFLRCQPLAGRAKLDDHAEDGATDATALDQAGQHP
jgi:hypothetical protein